MKVSSLFLVPSIVWGALISTICADPVPLLMNYQGRVEVEGVDFDGTGQFKFAIVSGGSDVSRQARATATVDKAGQVDAIEVDDGGRGYNTHSPPAVVIQDVIKGGSGATAQAYVDRGVLVGIQVTAGGSGYDPAAPPKVLIEPPGPIIQYTSYWSNDGTSTNGLPPTGAVSVEVHGGLFQVMLGDASLANMDPLPTSVFTGPNRYLRLWFSDGIAPFTRLSPDQPFGSVPYAMMAAQVGDGAITEESLADGAVTADKLGGGSVTAAKLAGGAVTGAGLAGGSVTGDKIADASIMTRHLGPNSVDSSHIVDDSVSSGDIGSSQIKSNHIQDGTISVADIGSSQIKSNHIQDGTISVADIGSSQVESSHILDGTIMDDDIGHDQIGTAHIKNSCIYASKLAPDAALLNLGASGQGLVPTGGVILSSDSTNAQLTGAGYLRIGQIQLDNSGWEGINAAGGSYGSRYRVWTGTEMLCWGPSPGGRYNPTTDTWSAMSSVGAPEDRTYASAVWTGSRMIIWGGRIGTTNTDTGAMYNPSTNTWSSVTTTGAPSARAYHSAVWDGTHMIIWSQDSGGRYNPATDTWTSMSSATPSGFDSRSNAIAVWTGSEMIVWGGGGPFAGPFPVDGARYKPSTDSWSSMSSAHGLPEDYPNRSGVWTGQEFIVWGGGNYLSGIFLNTGARYNPISDTWTSTSTSGAPTGRSHHGAVWTGSKMIVWGGDIALDNPVNSGGIYDPATDSWSATGSNGAPSPRRGESALWTGSRMIIWSNGNGGRYNPDVDSMYLWQKQ